MENQEDTSGVLFIGCMFLAMGVGFIASAFYKKEKPNKK
jgi:hypothetical protein